MRRIPHESDLSLYIAGEWRIDGMNGPFARIWDEGQKCLYFRTTVFIRVQNFLFRGWRHPLVCRYLNRTCWDGTIGTEYDDIDL